MPNDRLHRLDQADAFSSPWTLRLRLKLLLWQIIRYTLFHPTPKFLSDWRVLLLKCFGARVSGKPFVASSAVVKMPWNLTLEDRACLGEHAEAYSLGPITLRARCTIAQHAYLCAGTHDLADPRLPLVVGPIDIGEDVFVGVRALVLPGILVGAGAVIGAGAVVTKDVAPWTIVGGNPAKPIRERQFPT